MKLLLLVLSLIPSHSFAGANTLVLECANLTDPLSGIGPNTGPIVKLEKLSQPDGLGEYQLSIEDVLNSSTRVSYTISKEQLKISGSESAFSISIRTGYLNRDEIFSASSSMRNVDPKMAQWVFAKSAVVINAAAIPSIMNISAGSYVAGSCYLNKDAL